MRSVVLLLVVLLLAVTASAEIPQVVSYQGKVTDTGGSPVVDGNWMMRFRIYDAATSGTMLWDSGDRLVAVAGGIFSILLGESPQPALSLAFDADYWLQVTFSGADQTPRQRVASTGYAYMASGLVAGTEVSGSVTTGTLSALRGTNTATAGQNYGGVFINYSASGRGIYGQASATTGETYGGLFEVLSPTGRAVAGESYHTSGSNYGGYFRTWSTTGTGVYGVAITTSGTTYGVRGVSASTGGRGVYGEATATSGFTYGVHGLSASISGRGVRGTATATSGYTYGVEGSSASTEGHGVGGTATATSGATYGVRGESASTAGRGVYGWANATSGTTYGVVGVCASPSGYGGYFFGRLRAEASISAGATPGNHVAEICNSSTGTSPDVLCLKVGYTANPGSSINYLTFVNGTDTGIGAVEGDGAGGVTFLSGGSDYAEYLPRRDGEALEPGDVVGVFEGEVTKRTEGASQVMVVSTRPIVLGNNPGEDKTEGYARVAFIGQVEVKVRGAVEAGDLLMPSGMGDGVAVAVSRDEIGAAQFRQVFGQAWEGSADGGVKRIRAAVGLLQHDPSVARLEEENRALRGENAGMRERLDALEAYNTRLESRLATLEAAR